MKTIWPFVLTTTFFSIIIIASIYVIVAVPDKWERRGWREAVVIRICHDGIPVVRLPNGEVWVRFTWSARYRVENEQIVCP